MAFATPSHAVSLTTGGVLRHVTCWKIERLDGVTLYFTAYPRPIVVNNQTYVPAVAQLTAQQSVDDMSGDTTEFRGAITSDAITDTDLALGLYRGATVTEFTVDWKYPFAPPIRSCVYYITETEYDETQWRSSLSGAAYRLSKRRGNVASKKCNVTRFGDDRCGLNLTPHTQTGRQVLGIVNEYRSFTSDVTGALGQLNHGVLTWTSGSNAGVESVIKRHTTAGLELAFRTPAAISVGDEFTVVRGCDRSIAQCIAFGNVLNFRGRPFLRGNKSLYSSP